MKQAVSDTAIEKATGQTWSYWQQCLNDTKARQLSHKEIVAQLTSEYGVDSWWAQTLAVRYEQSINRRVVGQSSSGEFYTSVSTTITGSIDDALEWWLQKNDSVTSYNYQKIVTSSTTQTVKWRYWRAVLADNSKVVVAIYQKTPNTAQLSLQHEKLASQDATVEWREYWRQYLDSR